MLREASHHNQDFHEKRGMFSSREADILLSAENIILLAE